MGLLRESYRQFDVNGSYKVILKKKKLHICQMASSLKFKHMNSFSYNANNVWSSMREKKRR